MGRRRGGRGEKALIAAALTVVPPPPKGVAHEVLALEMLILMLENPSADGVEMAVDLIKEVGDHLNEVAPQGLHRWGGGGGKGLRKRGEGGHSHFSELPLVCHVLWGPLGPLGCNILDHAPCPCPCFLLLLLAPPLATRPLLLHVK